MEPMIITIGRQAGSGGREIGEKLAAALGVKCYDKELIELAAQKSGMDAQILAENDEKTVNRFLYSVPNEPNRVTGYGMPIVDTLFIVQSQIIQELANKEPCVIIGRSADYVLRYRDNVRNVFVFAPLEDRVRRVAERLSITEEEARDTVKSTDKRRKSYYNYFTDKKWGQREGYHVCLDSSVFGVDGCVRILKDIVP